MLTGRVDDSWSDVMACSGPGLSNSQSSSLGVAGEEILKAQFLWRKCDGIEKFKYSSMHSREIKTEKKTTHFGHIDTLDK